MRASSSSRGLLAGLLALTAFGSTAVAMTAHEPADGGAPGAAAAAAAGAPATAAPAAPLAARGRFDDDGTRAVAGRGFDGGRGRFQDLRGR